jgi:hypothetical protein
MIFSNHSAPFVACCSCGDTATIYVAFVCDSAGGRQAVDPSADFWLCNSCKASLRGMLTTALEAQERTK